MDDWPTIEQRISAAMALAGLDDEGLSKKIAANGSAKKGYSARTIERIRNPKVTARVAEDPDLAVIAKACGVSPAFWTVDFRQLEEPSLQVAVSELQADVKKLGKTVAQQSRELRVLRDKGRQQEPHATEQQ